MKKFSSHTAVLDPLSLVNPPTEEDLLLVGFKIDWIFRSSVSATIVEPQSEGDSGFPPSVILFTLLL